MALSPSKKFLAVCEKAERAVCTVYVSSMDAKNNMLVFKKKKILTSVDYHAKEFISVAFSPLNDKSHLVTLVSFNVCFLYVILGRLENRIGRLSFGCGISRSASLSSRWRVLAICWLISAHSITKTLMLFW